MDSLKTTHCDVCSLFKYFIYDDDDNGGGADNVSAHSCKPEVTDFTNTCNAVSQSYLE